VQLQIGRGARIPQTKDHEGANDVPTRNRHIGRRVVMSADEHIPRHNAGRRRSLDGQLERAICALEKIIVDMDKLRRQGDCLPPGSTALVSNF